MILTIPTSGKKYLTPEEIREHNEWCARLAQLTLLGAKLDAQTETKVFDARRPSEKTAVTIDEVPEPFAEHPEVKCGGCGNTDLKRFSLVYYERRFRPIRGFDKTGHLVASDDVDSDGIGMNDPVVAARALAGDWLSCHECGCESAWEHDIYW